MLENILFSMNSTMPLFFIMLLGYVLHRTGFLAMRSWPGPKVRATFDGRYALWASSFRCVTARGGVPCYRSSGSAFLQSIYGDASMSSLMILGSVPLYNMMAVVILMLEGPDAAQTGSMTAKLKKSVKGILTNPILLGIAAGFAWSLLGLPMPTMAGKTLSSIASLTSPLALLAIGAGFKGRKALGYLRPTAVATAVKLMALPALFLPLAVHLGFTDEKLVALLVMLGSITTPSVLRYGKADGPRRCAYRQRVRYHHPVQRIQPDLLAVRAAEPRVYFITSFA